MEPFPAKDIYSMRVPFLPIVVDEFGACEGVTTYFLSHFHTDHLRGLTPSWSNGIIYTSATTRALLIAQFGDNIGRRTVAVPLNVFVSVPLSTPLLGTRDPAAAELCLLNANHIPGSVMFYFRTFVGTILYTGDFKFDDTMERSVAPFFALHPVDHLFVDDTWLHLTESCAGKLLSVAELDSAFEVISRRIRLDAARFELQRQEEQTKDAINALDELERLLRLRARTSCFVVRCYLHNHFGKEPFVQRLAKKLGTKVEVDDERYAKLAAMHSVDSDQDDVDLAVFEPASRYEQHPSRIDSAVDDPSVCVVTTSGVPNPCGLVIVNSRADIHPAALERSSKACGGVPHFAVVMSGWAKLQRHELSHPNVFQVPFTLHCTPSQIMRFTQLLKPKSVTPIHYRRSRAVSMMVHLGGLLRTPFTNEVLSASALANAAVPLGLRGYVASQLPSCEVLVEGSGGKQARVRLRDESPFGAVQRRVQGVRIATATRSRSPEDMLPNRQGGLSGAVYLTTFLELVDSDDEVTTKRPSCSAPSRITEAVLLLSQ